MPLCLHMVCGEVCAHVCAGRPACESTETMWTRQAGLCLPSAGTEDVHHHTQILKDFLANTASMTIHVLHALCTCERDTGVELMAQIALVGVCQLHFNSSECSRLNLIPHTRTSVCIGGILSILSEYVP